ncbi:hypothetical protein GCM10010521_48400 [Streptomyces rameus]|uniref:Uncharacterized protein n=1 Tax=Streptomyces rameus TaxID=68261 RepID=A0ABP6NRJ9_9ACTN
MTPRPTAAGGATGVPPVSGGHCVKRAKEHAKDTCQLVYLCLLSLSTRTVNGRVPRRGVADHGLSAPLRSRPVPAAAGRLAIAAGPGSVSPNSASGVGNSSRDLGIPPP